MQFDSYQAGPFFDEMFHEGGQARQGSKLLARYLQGVDWQQLRQHQDAADAALRNMGITFNVYGHAAGAEKIMPFDVLPRVIEAREWSTVERGLRQRITALNLFLDDVYNEQKILRDKVVPAGLIEGAPAFRPQCKGLRPPQGIWCHVTGTDLVRDKDGQFYVLEDNLRCPSGVSYVLENRAVMKQTFPQVFAGMRIEPVEDYADRLLDTLLHCAPRPAADPTAVVLTPGAFNSAYYEHTYLAQQMGVELVQGCDLTVSGGRVAMRTTRGLAPVDVIYRRIDDDFLDPACFREDSLLGVRGLMEVYRSGGVALANAPGGGIADDKAVYAFVPEIIRYYLGEDAILPNVPTFRCGEPAERDHVLGRLHELVVKPTNESGGYGIVIGPHATKQEREACAERIRANPRNFIAQPMLSLSTMPTLVDGQLEARHVDLRPFILSGESVYVLPGGLTRVALRRGSLVVNSSQGGGSKDSWVLASIQPYSLHEAAAHAAQEVH